MRKALLSFAVFAAFFFVSCQKEIDLSLSNTSTNTGSNNQAGGNSLIGKWKFVSTFAKTFTSNELNFGGVITRNETTSEYTSINNTGTIEFTAQTMSSVDIAYEVNTIAYGKMYEDNVLIDTFSMPFNQAVPPSSSQANYTRVNADSITIQGGFMTVNGNPASPTTPSGARIRFSNDTLFIKQNASTATVENFQGMPANIVRKLESETILKKL